jgi:hypothetical protein
LQIAAKPAPSDNAAAGVMTSRRAIQDNFAENDPHDTQNTLLVRHYHFYGAMGER